MSQVNLGGVMPDGSKAQDLSVEASEFVCASGAMLSRGAFTGLLGKLCLTRQSLVMLPYEGAMVEVAIKLAEQLEKKILGPFADMAEKLKKLGLYAKGPEVVKRVLVWPLSTLETNAEVRSHMLGGADLIVTSGGMKYEFNMRGKGHQPAGFASAEDFRDQINRLRLRL
jgi:hypothetical protein